MLALTSASVRNQNQGDLIPALPVAASLPLSHSSTFASCLLLLPPSPQLDSVGDAHILLCHLNVLTHRALHSY